MMDFDAETVMQDSNHTVRPAESGGDIIMGNGGKVSVLICIYAGLRA